MLHHISVEQMHTSGGYFGGLSKDALSPSPIPFTNFVTLSIVKRGWFVFVGFLVAWHRYPKGSRWLTDDGKYIDFAAFTACPGRRKLLPRKSWITDLSASLGNRCVLIYNEFFAHRARWGLTKWADKWTVTLLHLNFVSQFNLWPGGWCKLTLDSLKVVKKSSQP